MSEKKSKKQYEKGDVLTFPGQYRRRSVLQWLRGEEKTLQHYVITIGTDTPGGVAQYERKEI